MTNNEKDDAMTATVEMSTTEENIHQDNKVGIKPVLKKGSKTNSEKPGPATISKKSYVSQSEQKMKPGYENFSKGFIEVKAERVSNQTKLLISGSSRDDNEFSEVKNYLKAISLEFSQCLKFQEEMAQALNVSIEQVGGIVFGNKAILDFMGKNYQNEDISCLVKMGTAYAPKIWGQILDYIKIMSTSEEENNTLQEQTHQDISIKNIEETNPEFTQYVLKSDFASMEKAVDSRFQTLSNQISSQVEMVNEMATILKQSVPTILSSPLPNMKVKEVEVVKPKHETTVFIEEDNELNRNDLILHKAKLESSVVQTETGKTFSASLTVPEDDKKPEEKVEEKTEEFGF